MNIDPNAILRVPVRLVLGPTQAGLLLAYPHGGTALGMGRLVDFDVEEESGGEVYSQANGKCVAVVRGFTTYRLTFLLVQYDTDVLQQVYGFAGTTLREPDVGRSQQPGLKGPSAAVLIAPYDRTNHAALVVFAPYFGRGRGRSRYGVEAERGELIEIIAGEDGAGHCVAQDYLANLSLT